MSGNIPTRATVAGRAYLDLQNLARRDDRPTDEYVQFFALEGMLARLTVSEHAEKFVLKGVGSEPLGRLAAQAKSGRDPRRLR